MFARACHLSARLALRARPPCSDVPSCLGKTARHVQRIPGRGPAPKLRRSAGPSSGGSELGGLRGRDVDRRGARGNPGQLLTLPDGHRGGDRPSGWNAGRPLVGRGDHAKQHPRPFREGFAPRWTTSRPTRAFLVHGDDRCPKGGGVEAVGLREMAEEIAAAQLLASDSTATRPSPRRRRSNGRKRRGYRLGRMRGRLGGARRKRAKPRHGRGAGAGGLARFGRRSRASGVYLSWMAPARPRRRCGGSRGEEACSP